MNFFIFIRYWLGVIGFQIALQKDKV